MTDTHLPPRQFGDLPSLLRRVLPKGRIRIRGRSKQRPYNYRLYDSFRKNPAKQGGRFLMGLGGLLLLLPFAAHAQAPAPPIDREAVYKAALPLYQYDASRPLAVKTVSTTAIGTVKLIRFSYLSTNNQRVPALLFLPPGASRTHPVPCLVLLHGLGGGKEQMAGLALGATQNGYAALAIDEYGQGERAVTTAKDADPVKEQARQTAELIKTVRQSAVDVRRGLDYLNTRPDISKTKRGLVGISLGAIIGTVTAGVEPRLKATALVSGGGDWGLILRSLSVRGGDVGGKSTQTFKDADWARLSAALAPEDPLTFAPHIAPRPLLLIGGRKDTTIVPQATQELYEAARQPKQILWFAPYGHVPPPEVVYPALKTFFAKGL